MNETPSVSDLGEHELIERLTGLIGEPDTASGNVWAGDDTAVLGWPAGRLLFTIDTLVEGLDFDRAYATGSDIGWKAMASNASDIAAMGGRPRHAVVSVVLPGDAPAALPMDLVRGMIAAGGEWNIDLVGGDVSEGAEIVVSIAMTGEAETPVLRSGARPGDVICVTGTLGGAFGGLRVLQSGAEANGEHRSELVRRQLRPRALVAEGRAMAAAGVTAMIDVSDGLAVDLWHLCESSGIGCEIDGDAIPIDPALVDLDGLDGLEAAVTGGEDFELVATIDPAGLEQLRATLAGHGTALSVIGEATSGARRIGERALDEWRSKGWEHLRNR